VSGGEGWRERSLRVSEGISCVEVWVTRWKIEVGVGVEEGKARLRE
jgi:hypothetical protein